MFSLLILLTGGGGRGPSLDPLLCPTVPVLVGAEVGLGGGGLVPMDVVRRLGEATFRVGALIVFALSGPERDLSSWLCLVGRGDRAGLGDLVTDEGLEISGRVIVLFLMTGCFAGCGCQPVLREMVGGE